MPRGSLGLLLDFQSLESSQVPFDPAAAGVRVLVIDTRAKHELATGEYGNRQAECHDAAQRLGVPSLRAVTDVSELAALDDPGCTAGPAMSSRTTSGSRRWPRCCARPPAAICRRSLKSGRCSRSRDASLRDDFEVSWPEADVAVDVAVAAGALGARMTGGGFGGSAIALVPDTDTGQVESGLRAAYADRGWNDRTYERRALGRRPARALTTSRRRQPGWLSDPAVCARAAVTFRS